MIIVKKSVIHGKGVFAKEDIPKKSFIGTYEGEKTNRDSTYVLWVQDDNDGWFGVKGRNNLKYLNHSSKPNAEFAGGTELYAISKIEKGDEVTIHYGEEWEDIE
ncbi:MAG: SET domain-containing protein [bacterium]|nr:SET domain-containing protein [bacterium]